ncbi:ABC transporter ATP-binding protein [Parasphaerochaeta coccoides]|uniref:ABC transporter related protein n=1 Tax=Parasphaerochaeta coccoides (strain ATCC BAA-1237 / DSM 17374 / SPN1) TaxID=760011 RepID=F4GIT0_PARC1|nr:ATP-binding cassette domain-containing protein [Parasphaerochaeta coccoides]AEC02698.1 ABC transporter related protein [Parasphaerochaeta coccoides DSM 17374]
MSVQAVSDVVIRVENLTKEYSYYTKEQGLSGSIHNIFYRKKLTKCAVKNISFEVKKGSIVGFVGLNGAGKTTTLKILSGLIKETSGKTEVLGYYPFHKKKDFLKRISMIMGNKSQLWWDLPAIDSFYLNKAIYEIDENLFKSRLDNMVVLLGVKDLLNIQVRRLSLGERMKMELIAALLHYPEVIFLDEPTIGLDVITQYNIRNFLKDYVEKNKATIILTSHNFNDIVSLCDSIILLNHGEIIYSNKFSSFQRDVFITKDIILKMKKPITKEIKLRLSEENNLKYVTEGENLIRVTCSNECSIDVVAYLVRNVLDEIQDLSIENPNMDDVIRSIYQREA